MSCKPPYKRGHGGYCGCDCKCLAPECYDLIKVNYSCESSSSPNPSQLECSENEKICPGFNYIPDYCQDYNLPCIGFDCTGNGCEKTPYLEGMYYTYRDCVRYCENSKRYTELIPWSVRRLAENEKACDNGICPEDPTWVCCIDGTKCAATYADCDCQCEGKRGCTNPNSNNYDPDAKCDDGSCVTCCNASKCILDDRDGIDNCNRLPLLDGFQGGSNGCCDAYCLEANDCHPTFNNSHTVPAANSCSGSEFVYISCQSCLNNPTATPPIPTPTPAPTPPATTPTTEKYCYYCKYVPYGFNVGDGGLTEENIIEDQKIEAMVMTPVCKQVPLTDDLTCEQLGERDGIKYYDNLDDCFNYCSERKYCYKCEYTNDPNYGVCTEVDLPEGYTCDMLSSRDGITYYTSSDVCMKNCGDPNGYTTCFYCVELYSYGVCNETYIPYGQCGDFSNGDTEYYENYDTCYNACNPTTTTTTTTTPAPSYCTIEVTTDGCCLEFTGSNIYAVGDGAVSAKTEDQDCCESPEEYDILINGEKNSTTVTDGEPITITIDTDKSENNCICTEKNKEPSQKSAAGCPKEPTPGPVIVLDKKTNKIKILINKSLIR